jgi:hypothetical protein
VTTTDDIKGVTTLDTEAILRARSDVARPRGRLLSFITGEVPVELGGEKEAASLAPPDDAVRLEMLRLQMEAERADLEAEAVSMKTDVVLEQGIDLAALADADMAGDLPDSPGVDDMPEPVADETPAASSPPPPPAAT